MITVDKVKNIIEALLVVSEGGLTGEDLKRAIPDADGKDITEAIDLLKEDYDAPVRSFNIAEIAGRYRVVTKPEYMPWISNLYQKEPDRLKGASLETLAIVAYKQPATRGEIEAVRGVNVGGVLKTLLDKGLLEVRGRKDVIGKPLLYGTTEKFLELFGLNSLGDLPSLREFTEEDLDFGKPADAVPAEQDGEEVHLHQAHSDEERGLDEAPAISNEEEAHRGEDTVGGELEEARNTEEAFAEANMDKETEQEESEDEPEKTE